MSAPLMAGAVRTVGPDETVAIGGLYEAEAARAGFVRWGYMDAERAAYLCCTDRPERGTAFVSSSSDAFVAVVQKVASSRDAELIGPFPDASPACNDLLDAAHAWCAARGLRTTTWISAADTGRAQRFERLGYHREHQLVWMEFPPPALARPYTRYRSHIEVVDARERPEEYFALYNEAFERHLGDMRLAAHDFEFRMADPCSARSDFIMAVVDGQPSGLIELWADYDPASPVRVCWLTNIAVREDNRENLEIHLALLSEGATRMAQRRATAAKSLFDAARSQLLVLYSLVGGRLRDPFEFWVR